MQQLCCLVYSLPVFKQVVDTLVFRVIELSVIELDEQLLTFATLEDFHLTN